MALPPPFPMPPPPRWWKKRSDDDDDGDGHPAPGAQACFPSAATKQRRLACILTTQSRKDMLPLFIPTKRDQN